MAPEQGPPRSTVGGLGIFVAVLALVLLTQYGQVYVTGSSPQRLVLIFGSIAVAIVAWRAIARRR